MAAKNAFKGYSFQKTIYTFFALKMDIDREFKILEAEVDVKHNFDDIKVHSYDCNYHIQIKNYDHINKIIVTDNKVVINDNISVFENESTNIVIVKDYKFNYNSELFGLRSEFRDGIYFISLTEDDVIDYASREYEGDERRLYAIISLASKKCSELENSLKITELPEISIFSTELLEKTEQISNFCIDDKTTNCLFIEGKPGIGKSHLVNQLELPNNILYRFWIYEQDPNKNERLKFKSFIKDISRQVFQNNKNYGKEEIIKKIEESQTILIIDGLDHVENYNEQDLDKYIDFFDLLKEKSKIIIFSRPLKKEIHWQKIFISLWNKEEMKRFLMLKFGIKDYELTEQFYKKTSGYPIITDFLAKHYLLNEELSEPVFVDDIFKYYEELISNVEVRSILKIFGLNRSFWTFSELKELTKEAYVIFTEFMEKHRYLFEITLNRISTIHDSLNTYIIREPGESSYKLKYDKYTQESIRNREIRFLSRFNSLDLSKEFRKEMFLKYVDIKEFADLKKKHIDYESIETFYIDLKNSIGLFESNEISLIKYYDLTLIMNIIRRDNLSQMHQLTYNICHYIIKNKDYINLIFSSKELFDILYILKTGRVALYKNSLENSNYFSNSIIDSFIETASKEESFFNDYKNVTAIDIMNEIEKVRMETSEYLKNEQFIRVLAKIFLSNIDIEPLSGLINEFIVKKQTNDYKIYEINMRFGIAPKNINYIISETKDIIFKNGYKDDENDYLNLSLDNFIDKYKNIGSFDISVKIADYLRLAIFEDRDIDFESINKYMTMYNQRKDYSMIGLPEALRIFIDNNKLIIDEGLKFINSAQEMSEKGISGIMNDFINKMTIEDFKKQIDGGLFDRNYKIFVPDLNIDKINEIPKEIFLTKMEEHLGFLYWHPELDYMKYKNVFNSFHKENFVEFLKLFRVKIYNCPQSVKIESDLLEFDYGDDTPVEQSNERAIDKGYLSIEDLEYIKMKNISLKELAEFLDGWHSKFPIAEVFMIYGEKEFAKQIQDILYISILKARTKFGDGNYYYYIPNVLKLIKYIKKENELSKMFDSFMDFLKISLVR